MTGRDASSRRTLREPSVRAELVAWLQRRDMQPVLARDDWLNLRHDNTLIRVRLDGDVLHVSLPHTGTAPVEQIVELPSGSPMRRVAQEVELSTWELAQAQRHGDGLDESGLDVG